MIVDGHTHILSDFGNSIMNIEFSWKTLEQWLLSKPGNRSVVMPKVVQFCDSATLNIDFMKDLESFRLKRYVYPFIWIHPHQLEEQHFNQLTFSGFKFHPSISQTTIEGQDEMLALCEKYHKPIIVHCGRDEKSRIDYVLKINESYPTVKFICAHMGGLATNLIIRAFEKLAVSKFLDNIYLETSGCFHPELIRKAVDLLGKNKVIFGTDRPFHGYEMSYYAIRCCHFDKETEKKVLSRNILNILQPDVRTMLPK